VKRSRDSRYDKKRSRDKKDDQRKLKFSTKSTEKREKNERTRSSNKDERKKSTPEKRTQKPESRNLPKTQTPITSVTPVQENTRQTQKPSLDFEVYSQGDKAYKQRTTHKKKKSSYPKIIWPLAAVAFLFFIRFLVSIGDSSSDSITNDIPDSYDPVYQDRSVTTAPPKKRPKINAAVFIVGNKKKLREVTQLKEDSIINVIPNVQVRLFKGFHVYDSKPFPNIPVVASYSKFHFFYDVQDKVAEQSISEQWSILREKLAESNHKGYFMYQYPKEYEIDDLLINETEFSISTKGNIIYGVASLVEYKNKRYFFQFISKERVEKEQNYNYLRKYLNYYLKVKKSNESFSTSNDLNS